MIRFQNLSASDIALLNPRDYPGYPEYTLLDLPGGAPTRYYRGANTDYLDIPEARVWQRFILEHYAPPENGKLLMLHQCSWAKPYDLSATLQPLVRTCNPFGFVHRVIVSNVGLVPAELQMNPLFCAYDWPPYDEKQPELVDKYHETFKTRFDNYLSRHSAHYWGIFVLASRDAGSKLPIVLSIAQKHGLEVVAVPDQKTWSIATEEETSRDSGNVVRHPAVLSQCVQALEAIFTCWKKAGLNIKNDYY
jgi:hypothetical protein